MDKRITEKLIEKIETKNYVLTETDYCLLSLLCKSHMMSIHEENFIKNLSEKYKELG